MRFSLIAGVAGMVVLALAGVARADQVGFATVAAEPLRLSPAHPIPTTVASQPGPIRLDGCFSDGRGADGLTLVHHAVRISNTGDRAVTAVRVRFAFYDAFGDVNAVRSNIAEVRIEPGGGADRINLAELADSSPPVKISCSVDAIRYADGTIVRTEPGPPAQR